MEAPEYFIGGYFNGGAAADFFPAEKRLSDQKSGEHFAVDDLLDFPNEEDAIMADGFFDNISKNYSADNSSTFTSNDSCNTSVSGNHNIGHHNFADSHFSSELCVPYDDVAELEWLSNFVEDSFSTEQNLQANLHIISGSKQPTPESSSSESNPEPSLRNPNNPIFQPDIPLPGKARSKRSRAVPCDWSTRLLHLTPTAAGGEDTPPEKQGDDSPNSNAPPARKCLHCASEKTPQWRTGPMGPKTLCNACGVRYKSGRLVPEYRPAASPTFISAKHSNSHRKVVELRRQKEMQRAQQEQYLHQSSIFGVSNGGDEFLIRGVPTFRHMI